MLWPSTVSRAATPVLVGREGAFVLPDQVVEFLWLGSAEDQGVGPAAQEGPEPS